MRKKQESILKFLTALVLNYVFVAIILNQWDFTMWTKYSLPLYVLACMTNLVVVIIDYYDDKQNHFYFDVKSEMWDVLNEQNNKIDQILKVVKSANKEPKKRK